MSNVLNLFDECNELVNDLTVVIETTVNELAEINEPIIIGKNVFSDIHLMNEESQLFMASLLHSRLQGAKALNLHEQAEAIQRQIDLAAEIISLGVRINTTKAERFEYSKLLNETRALLSTEDKLSIIERKMDSLNGDLVEEAV